MVTFQDSLAWPDRFFPFFLVMVKKKFFFFSATTKKNGKKQSGHTRLVPRHLSFPCATVCFAANIPPAIFNPESIYGFV